MAVRMTAVMMLVVAWQMVDLPAAYAAISNAAQVNRVLRAFGVPVASSADEKICETILRRAILGSLEVYQNEYKQIETRFQNDPRIIELRGNLKDLEGTGRWTLIRSLKNELDRRRLVYSGEQKQAEQRENVRDKLAKKRYDQCMKKAGRAAGAGSSGSGAGKQQGHPNAGKGGGASGGGPGSGASGGGGAGSGPGSGAAGRGSGSGASGGHGGAGSGGGGAGSGSGSGAAHAWRAKMIMVPAPQETHHIHLGINDPPASVRLKGWYCTNADLKKGVRELANHIANESPGDAIRDAETWSDDLKNGWPFNLPNMHQSPVKRGLIAPPGGGRDYPFKYCYTKDELRTFQSKVRAWLDAVQGKDDGDELKRL